MDRELQPGDLVRLKSGGPIMVFEGVSPQLGDLICCWFEGCKRMRAGFSRATLQRIEK